MRREVENLGFEIHSWVEKKGLLSVSGWTSAPGQAPSGARDPRVPLDGGHLPQVGGGGPSLRTPAPGEESCGMLGRCRQRLQLQVQVRCLRYE